MDNLPAGQYFQKTTTDQNGSVSISLTNQLKATVAAGTAMAGSGPSTQYLKSATIYDPSQNPAVLNPPNFYAPPAGSTPTDWVTTRSYDIFGRVIRKDAPDIGQTLAVYDDAGRLRFGMDADGASQTPNRVLYYKYDILGRPTENGLIEQDWNQLQLQQLANDPLLPTQARNWQKRFFYDGDGSVPNLIGRLSSSLVNNGDGTQVVEETLGYDLAGNVVQKDLHVPDFDDNTYSCIYAYNNLNKIISIQYPSQASIGGQPFQVAYRYNELGLVTGVGSSAIASESFATVEYYATSNIKQTRMNNG